MGYGSSTLATAPLRFRNKCLFWSDADQKNPLGSSSRLCPHSSVVCTFTELLGGLLPKLENLSTLHSIKVVFHASTNCFLVLSTSCLLCRLVPFCSCFLAFCSAFISFAPFSFVLTFFPCFLSFSFFLRFVACFLVCSCFVPFCSFLFFFLRFVAFFRLCPCVPFSFRLFFFFAPLVPFSPLSFFLSPVSLALLLPPLLFGLFPPEIAQVPAKTGWAMWNRLRGTGDWPVLNECMHSGAWFQSRDLWVMGPTH